MKFLKSIVTTPILISGIFVFIPLFYLFVDSTFINNQGGVALGGTFALFGLIIIIAFLLIEQAIARLKFVNKTYLWVVELILLGVIYFYFSTHPLSIG